MNNAQSLFDVFETLDIQSETIKHEAFFSAGAIDEARLDQWEFPVKNVFLHDKGKQFYLITVRLDTPSIDLKELAKRVYAQGRFSFAKEEDLADKLRVRPGSVTPYAIIHDKDLCVRVILDARLKTSASISAHPLSNDQTTTISTEDLKKLYAHTGHEPIWIDIPVKK
tara:strand:- start:426 stop:929 length:504 start_codon:yes stop_codon:yes gene_type:complete